VYRYFNLLMKFFSYLEIDWETCLFILFIKKINYITLLKYLVFVYVWCHQNGEWCHKKPPSIKATGAWMFPPIMTKELQGTYHHCSCQWWVGEVTHFPVPFGLLQWLATTACSSPIFLLYTLSCSHCRHHEF